MRTKTWFIGLIAITLALSSCSPSFNTYSDSMFQGKRMLDVGDYAGARNDFVRAAQAQPDAYSYAYAATASYKMNDFKGAEQFIRDAERLDGRTFAYLRILGYKALIFLGEGRQKEGFDALRDYIATYGNLYPLTTLREVEAMWKTGRVDLPLLERLLDEQINTYENDLWDFYNTGTGWYGQRYRRTLSLP